MYDPEAIYQDADIEMMELREAARAEEAAIKAGNCHHHSTGPRNYPEDKEIICYDCDHVFGTIEERDRQCGS